MLKDYVRITLLYFSYLFDLFIDDKPSYLIFSIFCKITVISIGWFSFLMHKALLLFMFWLKSGSKNYHTRFSEKTFIVWWHHFLMQNISFGLLFTFLTYFMVLLCLFYVTLFYPYAVISNCLTVSFWFKLLGIV